MAELYWHKAIREAKEIGCFTSIEKRKSYFWQDCACGKLDGRIPRHPNGEPMDKDLVALGVRFARYVNIDDFDATESALAAIEKRAAEILAEMGGK